MNAPACSCRQQTIVNRPLMSFRTRSYSCKTNDEETSTILVSDTCCSVVIGRAINDPRAY